jgi:hypothetical protein
MTKYFLYTFLLFVQNAVAQSSDETAIRTVLSTQQAAWNKGDINGFMQGYWKSDSLLL